MSMMGTLQPEAGDDRQRDIEVQMLNEKMYMSFPNDDMPEQERLLGPQLRIEDPEDIGRLALSGYVANLPGYWLG